MIRRPTHLLLGTVAITVFVISETHPLHSQTAPLQISDIYGLQQALNIRPVMGPGFTVTAVAVIDDTGALDAAQGNPSDCVHIDGTSGPCAASTQGTTNTYNFVDGEIPSGIISGANATFSLANVPNPPTSLHLYRDGLRLMQAGDYSLNGASVTFIGSQIPVPGDTILADYRY